MTILAQMFSTSWYGWNNMIADKIFSDDIMAMVGLNDPEDLQRCRQVCQSWNSMIVQMAKYKKNTIKTRADILASRNRLEVAYFNSLPKSNTVFTLVHQGLLDSVEDVQLVAVDLASVPTSHLVSLVSCVTESISIINITNCDIISILDSVRCPSLSFRFKSLGSEETQALVRAMESHVERLSLGSWGEVSLDMAALNQYRGQGKCSKVLCNFIVTIKYKEELKTWAQDIKWRVGVECEMLLMKRVVGHPFI